MIEPYRLYRVPVRSIFLLRCPQGQAGLPEHRSTRGPWQDGTKPCINWRQEAPHRGGPVECSTDQRWVQVLNELGNSKFPAKRGAGAKPGTSTPPGKLAVRVLAVRHSGPLRTCRNPSTDILDPSFDFLRLSPSQQLAQPIAGPRLYPARFPFTATPTVRRLPPRRQENALLEHDPRFWLPPSPTPDWPPLGANSPTPPPRPLTASYS